MQVKRYAREGVFNWHLRTLAAAPSTGYSDRAQGHLERIPRRLACLKPAGDNRVSCGTMTYREQNHGLIVYARCDDVSVTIAKPHRSLAPGCAWKDRN